MKCRSSAAVSGSRGESEGERRAPVRIPAAPQRLGDKACKRSGGNALGFDISAFEAGVREALEFGRGPTSDASRKKILTWLRGVPILWESPLVAPTVGCERFREEPVFRR